MIVHHRWRDSTARATTSPTFPLLLPAENIANPGPGRQASLRTTRRTRRGKISRKEGVSSGGNDFTCVSIMTGDTIWISDPIDTVREGSAVLHRNSQHRPYPIDRKMLSLRLQQSIYPLILRRAASTTTTEATATETTSSRLKFIRLYSKR